VNFLASEGGKVVTFPPFGIDDSSRRRKAMVTASMDEGVLVGMGKMQNGNPAVWCEQAVGSWLLGLGRFLFSSFYMRARNEPS
jgi:hypothetical protein